MKPILFNTEMVRAALDGRKTVTRRVVRFPPGLTGGKSVGSAGDRDNPLGLMWACGIKRPPCLPGDILYVRETWFWCPCWYCGMDTDKRCINETAIRCYNDAKKEYGCYGYKAYSAPLNEPPFGKWHPSIHMPKEAARLFLRVTGVRVERLQDMTENDARAEGAEPVACLNCGGLGCSDCVGSGLAEPALVGFYDIWDSIIKPKDRDRYGLDANPWVWVVEFERISREEAENDSTGSD